MDNYIDKYLKYKNKYYNIKKKKIQIVYLSANKNTKLS